MFGNTKACYRAGPRAGGFTLIELMITLAVAAVLLAVGVPSFNQMIIANRLATQANEIVGAVTLARSEAIKRNASITLCRADGDDEDAECVDGAGDWENWIVVNAAGTILQRGVVNTYGGTFVVTSTLGTDQVVFGPDGLARTDDAIIATDAVNNQILVCSTRLDENNQRLITLGAGSRVTTTIPEEDDDDC